MSDIATYDTRLARFLRAFFVTLEAEGIEYCVLRNYAELPQRTDNDIDIWVSDQSQADRVLHSSARRLDLELAMTSAPGVRNYWLVPSDDRLAGTIHIDLVAALRWRNTTLVPAEVIANARRRYKGFWVPDDPIEGACLLLAGLLSTGMVKEKYRATIRAGATEHAATFDRILAAAFGPTPGGTLADHVRAADWGRIEGLVPRLRRAAPVTALRRAPAEQFALWARYICQLTKKVLFPPGATIAIVGVDGSGKTTLAERLETRLRRVFPVTHRFRWFAGGLPRASRVTRRDAREKGAGYHERPQAFNLARAAYYLVDYRIASLLRFRWVRAFCGIVMSDRYYHDFLVPILIRGRGSRASRFACRVLLALAPRPDLVIFLDVSPETAHGRKQEDTVEYLAMQDRELRFLLSGGDFDGRLVTLDAGRDAAAVLDDAQRAVFDRLVAR